MNKRYLQTKAALLLAALSLAACSPSDSDGPEPAERAGATPSSTDRQTAFRVRADFNASLNAEDGWAAALNQPATVEADQPFRIRFEVEAGDQAKPRVFSLQFRRNEGDWQPLLAEDFPFPVKQLERSPGAADRDLTQDWTIAQGAANLQRMPDATGDVLRIEAGEEGALAWAEPETDWLPKEFSLELRLPADSRSEFGLVFEDRPSGGQSYIALIPPERAELVRLDDGERRVVAEATARIPVDQWVELKVEWDGERWIAELQDEILFDWQPPNSPQSNPRPGVYLQAASRVDLRTLTIEGEASTPRTSIVSSPVFDHGSATEDQLAGSSLPFAGGAGLSFAARTPPWTAQRQQGEWSVPIVIRRFADQAALNEAGDTFDFRLVDTDGQAVPAQATASVQLAVPDGHLGGTFVETPMRLGPWQTETGDLFFIMEPSETWNLPIMVKSSDDGRSWREVDSAGRPATGDLEGLATVHAEGRIHVLHQITDEVLYHAFDPSSGVESWVIRDEQVAAPPAPPTQVADLAVRSDGSIVAVYGVGQGLHYAIRSPDGRWSAGQDIPGPEEAVLSGPTLVLGRQDLVHLAYTASNGTAWVRRIDPESGMGEAVQVADALATGESDVGALLPLVTIDNAETVVLVYRTRSGQLFERRSSNHGVWTEPVIVTDRTVVQSAVDSDQVGADMIADGNTLHVLFIEDATGTLFHTVRTEDGWRDPEAVVTGSNVQWVRGQVIRSAQGDRVYGFVYDGGSNGGSGRNRFLAVPLHAPLR